MLKFLGKKMKRQLLRSLFSEPLPEGQGQGQLLLSHFLELLFDLYLFSFHPDCDEKRKGSLVSLLFLFSLSLSIYIYMCVSLSLSLFLSLSLALSLALYIYIYLSLSLPSFLLALSPSLYVVLFLSLLWFLLSPCYSLSPPTCKTS